MSRIDVPTLRCDRCGDTTQDTGEMAAYNTLIHYTMSDKEDWDLCQVCWTSFHGWVAVIENGADDE